MRTSSPLIWLGAVLLTAALVPLAPYTPTPAQAADPAAATVTATWLRSQLPDGRIYVNQQHSFTDVGLSIDILLAQAASGAPSTRTTAIANQVVSRTGQYTTYDGGTFAGATGKALLATAVTRTSAGDDLRRQALATVGPSGRVRDLNVKTDYANTLSQGYVMLGLARTGELPQSTVDYLVSRQCSDGYFALALSDQACAPSEQADTDATALAVMALRAAKPSAGSPAGNALDKATAWLISAQDRVHGGWKGGVGTPNLNTNSTGLAAAALAGRAPSQTLAQARDFVLGHWLSEGPDRGAIAYDQAGRRAGVDANRDQWVRASAQGILALHPVSFDTLTAAEVAPGAYVPVTSFRIADTRASAKIAASQDLTITVAGAAELPRQVGAVVLNVTVTEPDAAGYISAFPHGVAAPTASSLNFVAGQTIPNLVMVKAGVNGQVVLRNSSAGATHLIADVVGYLTPGQATEAGMTSTFAPQRFLDTRAETSLAPNRSRELRVGGQHGVPAGAAAVVLNLTVTNPQAAGYITVGAAGSPAPPTSSLNFVPGETRPNLVVARIGNGGRIVLTNTSPGTADLVVDVVGYMVGGKAERAGSYRAAEGSRVYDGVAQGQALANRAVSVTVAQRQASGAVFSAVMTNLTAAQPTAGGYLSLVRGGARYPAPTSTVNFATGRPSSNAALAETSESGTVDIHHASSGTAYALLDQVGGFLA